MSESSERYVVVTQTSSQCEVYPEHTCVMEVFGPYDTRDEAVKVAEKCPVWAAPHIGILRELDAGSSESERI